MLEDKRLITKLKRGDKDALCQIYEKYKENLLIIATSLLHDAGAAEDILHEVMVSFAAGAWTGCLEFKSPRAADHA
jgi:DNA-directed RNA polymerase specialized sigma24 family protein